ncbi:MAG: BadF/BadG/BcrA/BcrD ATPase family protein [Acholeplasmataceae bacterium]
MANYIIGVDGGGTKTLGVLYDMTGKKLLSHTVGFTNFNIDYDQAKANLIELLDYLYRRTPLLTLSYIQLGISGYSKVTDKKAFEKELSLRYGTTVSLESDVMIAYYDIKRESDKNVLVVIGGTGSVIMYSNKNRLEQHGGYGHILGDEGSAYHLSITALKDVIAVHDETDAFDEFGKYILEHLSLKTKYDVRDYVYNNDKSKVARLSEFIKMMAEAKVEKAVAMVQAEAEALAKQTLQAYAKMKNKENLVIALRGGFLTKGDIAKKMFVKELRKNIKDFKVNESEESPVKGAYYLSLSKLKKR